MNATIKYCPEDHNWVPYGTLMVFKSPLPLPMSPCPFYCLPGVEDTLEGAEEAEETLKGAEETLDGEEEKKHCRLLIKKCNNFYRNILQYYLVQNIFHIY